MPFNLCLVVTLVAWRGYLKEIIVTPGLRVPGVGEMKEKPKIKKTAPQKGRTKRDSILGCELVDDER